MWGKICSVGDMLREHWEMRVERIHDRAATGNKKARHIIVGRLDICHRGQTLEV
jgi:hypothetical protein